ncbi:MAG: hypothetical protein HQL99_15765 [Magnetococcales bacterium]|nr:hypothetical protein [Magnetococcales bacterium]
MRPGARLRVSGWIGLLWGCLWVGEGWAGLFCVTDFSGQRCSYADVESCRRAAGRQGGCALNVAALVKPTGGAPFCLVESWRTHCIYPDRIACEQRAAVLRTVCVIHPNQEGMANQEEMRSGAVSTGVTSAPASGYLPSPGYQPGIEK